MADGTLTPHDVVAQIIDGLPIRKAPRIPTVDECFDDFADAVAERCSGPTRRDCVLDGSVIREMAGIIVEAHAKLAACHKRLGEARHVTGGYADMAPLDAASVTDSFFWESLSLEAHRLLTAETRERAS